ncbi:hypothetical protein [Bacteroides fluxus]|jgi:hypothetical protein|uniref:hypothetical protein n=1 Tax=Bacteroides fluxus TaxID=626930 RepID=UPI002A7EB800|nr:hypothetical protein [Bacteroides fluxus]MDY3789364.1 hypothetical protein [Bacteroides fluxus]
MRVFYESKLAKRLLWQGYSTITLGCFVFTRKSREEMERQVLNHEAIHVRQWEECTAASAVLLTVIMIMTGFSVWAYLLCPLWFYLQYGMEYLFSRMYHLFRGVWGKNGNKVSYENSTFEMEAKSNEMIDGYLDVRTPFEFFRYYGKI